MTVWTEASTQELKKVGFYGKPLLIPLDFSLRYGSQIDVGCDWDYGMSDDIVRKLICFWCEQDVDAHKFWFPIIVYRLLQYEQLKFEFDLTNFAYLVISNLSELNKAIIDQHGDDYYRYLLCPAAGVVCERYKTVPDAQDLAICMGAFQIRGLY